MITIGVDAHKRLHQAVATDERGRELDRWQGTNSPAGWEDLAAWAQALGDERQWGVEGARGNGWGLAQELVDGGETVYEVNARWTAEARRRSRRPGKSDPLDAVAVARVVLQEGPLPQVHLDDDTAVLALLVEEREAALAEATRLRNRIHALLAALDPTYEDHLPRLTTKAALRILAEYTSEDERPVQQERAASVRRLTERLRLTLEHAAAAGAEIEARAESYEPLTELCGVSRLTAGALAGILGPRDFATDAQLAAYAAVAPLEAASAGQSRHRLNSGGNRQLNAILYRIALTQSRCSEQGRAYLERRRAEGRSRREAIRALKRYLARAVWKLWQQCLPPRSAAPCT